MAIDRLNTFGWQHHNNKDISKPSRFTSRLTFFFFFLKAMWLFCTFNFFNLWQAFFLINAFTQHFSSITFFADHYANWVLKEKKKWIHYLHDCFLLVRTEFWSCVIKVFANMIIHFVFFFSHSSFYLSRVNCFRQHCFSFLPSF